MASRRIHTNGKAYQKLNTGLLEPQKLSSFLQQGWKDTWYK